MGGELPAYTQLVSSASAEATRRLMEEADVRFVTACSSAAPVVTLLRLLVRAPLCELDIKCLPRRTLLQGFIATAWHMYDHPTVAPTL